MNNYYTHNGYNGKVYHAESDITLIHSKEDSFDTEFPELIRKYTNNLLDPLSRMVPYSPYTTSTVNVLTYVISEKRGLNGETQNVIALNVNPIGYAMPCIPIKTSKKSVTSVCWTKTAMSKLPPMRIIL